MVSQYQDVLFVVFTGFFVAIGVASLAVLLGVKAFKNADPRFRRWALPGFVVGVVGAVFGLFRIVFLTAVPPLTVVLSPPQDLSMPGLKAGHFEYVGAEGSAPGTGAVDLALGEGGTWLARLRLSGDQVDKAIRLRFEDEDGGWWQVGPFFPNYVRHELKRGKPLVVVPAGTSWQPPGVVSVFAAEPGSEPATQGQPSLKFTTFARRLADRYNRPYYAWRVFVDEPPSVLQTISNVDYVLHPTFPEPFQNSRDRDRQFDVVAEGWGEFSMGITIHYANGKDVSTSYRVDLKQGWPWSELQVDLERIQVNEDGSPRATGWLFDVLLDGKPSLHLPKQDYDDRKGPSKTSTVNRPDPKPRSVGTVRVWRSQSIRVEVHGKRANGGDSASASAALGASGGALSLAVMNKQDPRKGSFVFHFTSTVTGRGQD